MKITIQELGGLVSREEWSGGGYLGHFYRAGVTDDMLLEAVNQMGLDIEEVFLWANSRPARHFMDQEPVTVAEFKANISEWLEVLKEEVMREIRSSGRSGRNDE